MGKHMGEAMKILVALLLCLPLSAQTWEFSFSALAVSRGADLYSSRGLYESNPLLRGPDGRFSMARGLAVTIPTLVFVHGVQKWAMRKWPSSRTPFIVTNFVMAGVTLGVAAHNERIR